VLAVYTGNDCSGLSCVEQTNYDNELQWRAESGKKYWLMVGSSNDKNAEIFHLTIEVRTHLPHDLLSELVFVLTCYTDSDELHKENIEYVL
jgi:hypothetical protein